MTEQGEGVYVGNTSIPVTGATAYLIELTFESAIPGKPYVFTTEIRVNTNLALHPWSEPVDRLWAEAKAHNVNLAVPRPGERVDVTAPPPLDPWWQALV